MRQSYVGDVMNLIEAIKSGRPHKRPGISGWIHSSEAYNAKDIVADDWEIFEPSVKITRTQFWEAARACVLFEVKRREPHFRGSSSDLESRVMDGCLNELAQRLGLEEMP